MRPRVRTQPMTLQLAYREPGGLLNTRRGHRESGRERLSRIAGGAQLKLSPQAQLPWAFGLSMVKPCFSIVSEKSIVAPLR